MSKKKWKKKYKKLKGRYEELNKKYKKIYAYYSSMEMNKKSRLKLTPEQEKEFIERMKNIPDIQEG